MSDRTAIIEALALARAEVDRLNEVNARLNKENARLVKQLDPHAAREVAGECPECGEAEALRADLHTARQTIAVAREARVVEAYIDTLTDKVADLRAGRRMVVDELHAMADAYEEVIADLRAIVHALAGGSGA